MNRLTAVLLAFVVALATISAAAASDGWRVFAKASGNDVFATARAAGTASHPRALEFRIDATPTQGATASWRVTCSAKSKAPRTTFGTSSGPTPFTRKIPIPLANADRCLLSVKSQLGIGGTLLIYLLRK
jgi:hypothetical protein